MAGMDKRVLLCNCEKSMAVYGKDIGAALGSDELPVHTNLCRREIARFEEALDADEIVVACTQEAALFSEMAGEAGKPAPRFFNIRETAGWSEEGKKAGPKMAALALLATRANRPARLKSIHSDGLCLVTGSGQKAVDAAVLLNRTLSVTLLLADATGILLPPTLDFPVFCGKVRAACGTLGNFEVTVDGYAAMLPSSRGDLQFAMRRDGAKSNCSVIFDLTGGTPLFTRHEGRDGYFRPDPGDPADVMRAIFEASAMSGEFEKPIYVGYDPEICAHSRSRITGCTKCIDNCPAGAITSGGDTVTVDAAICGGCGNCAAHCPTGAVTYQYPRRDDFIASIQLLARGYHAAGGKAPVLLFHDGTFGLEMIGATARFGRGLPHDMIPLQMHATSGTGHDALLTAISAGFAGVVVMGNPKNESEYDAVREEIALADAILDGLGHGSGRVELVFHSDPEQLEAALWKHRPGASAAMHEFLPVGGKRDIARAAIKVLAGSSADTHTPIALPASAPFGAVHIDADGCTLCLSCVSACPAFALYDNPDRPQLRFVESACVQCGLCAATCPEKVMTLEPRLSVGQSATQAVTLKEEEPFECIRCGKPFAARSTIEKITAKLGGSHRMFATPERMALLQMCDICRLEVQAENSDDPFALARRPVPRTTDDYIAERNNGLDDDEK